MKTCKCANQAMYDDECRDCYESRIRRETTDAYDADIKVRTRMMLHKERCRRRLSKNYDGPASFR